MVLRAPPAFSFFSLLVTSLNTNKTLLASTEESSSSVYQFTSVSNQSDFIPRYSNYLTDTPDLSEKSRSCTLNKSCCVFFHHVTFSFGELHFAPGDSELEIAVNIIDDDIPEEQEYFHVSLKNPKGGAEIGFGGHVTVFVPTNDDAHGVIGFAQVNRYFRQHVDLPQIAQRSHLCAAILLNLNLLTSYHKIRHI